MHAYFPPALLKRTESSTRRVRGGHRSLAELSQGSVTVLLYTKPQCIIIMPNDDFDDPVTVTDCFIMNFPFNHRNSWHQEQAASGSSRKADNKLLRQNSFEKSHSSSPVPTPGSLEHQPAQMLRHNHSLKYSGGALHGDPSLPQGFDHNYSSLPDEQLLQQQQQQRFLFLALVSYIKLKIVVLSLTFLGFS